MQAPIVTRKKKQHKKYKSQFLDNLCSILEARELQDIICWSSDGTYIQILNTQAFEKTVLPKFYKHSKLNSFIRQLNMYQFQKIYKDIPMAYSHPHFQRDRDDLLTKIERMKKKRVVVRHSTSEPRAQRAQADMEEHTKRKLIKISEEHAIAKEAGVSETNLESLQNAMEEMKGIAGFMLWKYGAADTSEQGRKSEGLHNVNFEC